MDVPYDAPSTDLLEDWFKYRLWFYEKPPVTGSSIVKITSSCQPDWIESSLKDAGLPTHGLTPRYLSWPEGMLWTGADGIFNPEVTKDNVTSIWP